MGGDKHTESLFLFSNRDYETRHRLPTLSFLSHYLLHASIHPLSLSHTPRHKDEKERESKHEAISLPTRAQTALALTHVPANQTLLDVCFLEEQPASLNLCLRQQTGKRKRERERVRVWQRTSTRLDKAKSFSAVHTHAWHKCICFCLYHHHYTTTTSVWTYQ